MTLWTIASQAPLSMGFPRKEPWSRLSFSFPGDLPDPEIKHMSPESSVLADRSFYHCANDSLGMPNYVYFFQCLMDLNIWPLLFISLYVIKKLFNNIDLGYHSPLIMILIDSFFLFFHNIVFRFYHCLITLHVDYKTHESDCCNLHSCQAQFKT